jgi:hypothetical protein
MANRKRETKREEIKKMEAKKREESGIVFSAALVDNNGDAELGKITFDTWYFLRSKKIPSKHAKEIIIVDFKARGLKNEETLETFDNALDKYGVKL